MSIRPDNSQLKRLFHSTRSPFIGISLGERIGVLSFYSTIALMILVIDFDYGDAEKAMIGVAFFVYMAVLCLPLIFYRRSWGWFHPLIFTTTYIAWTSDIGRSISVYLNGLSFHAALPGMSSQDLNILVVYGLVLSIISLISMYAGFFVPGKYFSVKIQTRASSLLSIKLFLTAMISLGALYLLGQHVGGMDNLLLQRGLKSSERISEQISGSHWHFLAGIFTTACFVWLALKPEIIYRLIFWAIFLLSLFFGFLASGSRSGVILPVIIAASIYFLHKQRVPYGKIIFIGVLGVASIGFLGEFREASRGVKDVSDINFDTNILSAIRDGANTFGERGAEGSGLYGILGRVPDQVDLLYGSTYLSIAAAPIPRIFWSEKPIAGGSATARHVFGRDDTAIPPGTIGEAFLNFYIPGVIIISFLWGVFLKILANFYESNSDDPSAVILYILTLFILRPNSEAAYDWLHTIFPAIICIIFFCKAPKIFISSRIRTSHKSSTG